MLKISSDVEVRQEDGQLIKKVKWKNDMTRKVVYNELDAMQNIKSEYVPKFFGYNISVEEYYIIMYSEYIRGETLNKAKGYKISLLFPQLILGLKDIFENGYIHGDIKPENIIISENNKVYYIDFGFSSKINPLDDSGRFYRGSIPYLLPDILTNKIKLSEFTSEILKKNDLYALANLFHWVLTGNTLYKVNKGDTRSLYIHRIETTAPIINTSYPEINMIIHLMINTEINLDIINEMLKYTFVKYKHLNIF